LSRLVSRGQVETIDLGLHELVKAVKLS